MDPELNTEVVPNAPIGTDTQADTGKPETPETPESRRETIEAAFEAAEEAADKPITPTDAKPPVVADKTTPDDPDAPVIKTPVAPRDKSELAPASWKPDAKTKWAATDPVVRQEVMRRERETAQIVSQNEGARRFTQSMSEVFQPHLPRLQAMGVQPHHAVEALLRSDLILSTGAPAARAEKLAKMIVDYGVDINLLDAALSGKQINQADPNQDRLLRAIDERLAPVNQMIHDQRQSTAQQEQQETQRLMSEVDQMEANPEKYPYFTEIRSDMADIIELSAKKGVYITTDSAYNKAISLNPEIAQAVARERQTETARVAAAASSARARKARGASLSISGSAGGPPSTIQVNPSDRRGTIAAAFNALDNR